MSCDSWVQDFWGEKGKMKGWVKGRVCGVTGCISLCGVVTFGHLRKDEGGGRGYKLVGVTTQSYITE